LQSASVWQNSRLSVPAHVDCWIVTSHVVRLARCTEPSFSVTQPMPPGRGRDGSGGVSGSGGPSGSVALALVVGVVMATTGPAVPVDDGEDDAEQPAAPRARRMEARRER
jgi:hypothetical protein